MPSSFIHFSRGPVKTGRNGDSARLGRTPRFILLHGRDGLALSLVNQPRAVSVSAARHYTNLERKEQTPGMLPGPAAQQTPSRANDATDLAIGGAS